MALIGYVRVSTDKQGRSGLGLEAQRAAIQAYALQHGGEIAAWYTEIESGRRDDRPQLEAAIAAARRMKAQLVFAKLDRLSRSVHFVAGLMARNVDFRVADMPQATPFMLHVYAALAEEEARKISERTTAALAAAKARGVRLGSPKARETVAAARAARSAAAKAHADNLVPLVRQIQASGAGSLAAVARALEARGIKTPRGGTRWQAVQVSRLLALAAETGKPVPSRALGRAALLK